MTGFALYNEIDPFAAAWLEQLIGRGLIAPGVVDRRSIEDIHPDDLRGFRQVHFFAGIGVWSYSLRRAGVPDDANVWTGSCPCQPFSAAGKGGGVDDERHLWPHFHHLIRECRPDLVFGEQVASKDGLAWLDIVHADMEGTGYAFGAVDTCSAGFGAPHIRQRLYWFGEFLGGLSNTDKVQWGWGSDCKGLQSDRTTFRWIEGDSFSQSDLSVDGVDHDHHQGLEGQRSRPVPETGHREGSLRPIAPSGEPCGMADGTSFRWDGWGPGETSHESRSLQRSDGFRDASGMAYSNDDEQRQGGVAGSSLLEGLWTEPCGRGVDSGLGNADCQSAGRLSGSTYAAEAEHGAARRDDHGLGNAVRRVDQGQSSGRPTNGFWADVDWLHCRDERWRPVEPFTFPLAHGAAARVGRLRGYGNAINAEQAIGFLEAFVEAKAIDVAPIHETTRNLDARSLTAELIGDLL